jgi:cbb3-type cytochrome oxidase subunit 1
MDRFVKNFIAMSIIYLGVAAILGVAMFAHQPYLGSFSFVHSHLMLLGWVSMMIYGVGYHILPRFAGRLVRYPRMAEFQFWAANIGLVGMVVLYPLMQSQPAVSTWRTGAVASGILEALSIALFCYNMIATIFGAEKEE